VQSSATLFVSLLPQLCDLMHSSEQDLQQLGVQLLGQCCIQLRKRGVVLAASADAATAKLVKEQLLPSLRCSAGAGLLVATTAQASKVLLLMQQLKAHPELVLVAFATRKLPNGPCMA